MIVCSDISLIQDKVDTILNGFGLIKTLKYLLFSSHWIYYVILLLIWIFCVAVMILSVVIDVFDDIDYIFPRKSHKTTTSSGTMAHNPSDVLMQSYTMFVISICHCFKSYNPISIHIPKSDRSRCLIKSS